MLRWRNDECLHIEKILGEKIVTSALEHNSTKFVVCTERAEYVFTKDDVDYYLLTVVDDREEEVQAMDSQEFKEFDTFSELTDFLEYNRNEL